MVILSAQISPPEAPSLTGEASGGDICAERMTKHQSRVRGLDAPENGTLFQVMP